MRKIAAALFKALLLGLLVTLLVVFASSGLGFSVEQLRYNSLINTDHSQYLTVQGTVTYFSREQDIVSTSTLTFTYEVAGVIYYGLQGWHSGGHTYSKGDKVTVYYNPAKPKVAVIEQGKSIMPLGSITLGFVIGSVSFVIYTCIVVWVWLVYGVSYRVRNGREIAVWSWGPNFPNMWLIAGVALGLIVTTIPFFDLGLSDVTFCVLVGVYLLTPVLLAAFPPLRRFAPY
jgi:hypothetical protein